MISIETMKYRTNLMVGKQFPLVFWRGKATIAAVGDDTIDLVVRGQRASLTWERLLITWNRLQANHVLTVDELGGDHDAVGIVSLFAFMQQEGLDVVDADGRLQMQHAKGTPVHQYVDARQPATWAPWRRKIHGD